MASVVAELDSLLTSMLDLAPPGVSKTKITSITTLCNANIQSESVLIQKIYAHFKKAPPNKKLGVLYVVDAVVRAWLEQARKASQPLGPAAADGTYAAGVNHVAELLPALMQDISSSAPEDQKARIKKLVDIWERGNTFHSSMLASFRAALDAPVQNAQSTTPTGTPPQTATAMGASAAGAASAQDNTSSILANLQALASLAKPAMPAAAATPVPSAANVSLPGQPGFLSGSAPPVAAMPAMPQMPGPMNNVPTPVNNGVFPYGAAQPSNPYGMAQQPPVQQPPMMPMDGGAGVPDKLQQQLQILSALKAQGIPQDQWPALLSVLMASGTPANAMMNMNGNQMSRDGSNYDQYGMRSPGGRHRGRSRSRSPGWNRRDNSPRGGRRRDSPDYNRNGNGRGAYRGRSPDRLRRSPSPRRGAKNFSLPEPGPRHIEMDPSLPPGTVKVYSRTLFVGGVTFDSTEEDLRGIFNAFGRVQTCIVNPEKRHAFVKMISREEAQRAKDGMDHYRHPELQLRTRWGVGYGPRDCSDYSSGVSIIPIDRLTEADRKWMLTADFGGTGGKPLEAGMCVEEPDIEIGAGVSSKAISRRMTTDRSGTHGPRSSRFG